MKVYSTWHLEEVWKCVTQDAAWRVERYISGQVRKEHVS